MPSRPVLFGLLGWLAPGAVALPFAFMSEVAGGEAALMAIIVWWGLGVIGCLIAGGAVGAGVAGMGPRANDFRGGLAGVAAAWLAALIANMVIESAVQVLHLGALTFLLPIPFVIGYGVGFAVGAVANRPGGLTGPEKRP